MRRLGTALFPLVLIAMLAMLTFWLERAANPDSPVRKAEKRHDPDFIASKIEIRHFGASGELKQSLLAATMTHFPDDDSTLIAKPQLTYHGGEKGERTTEVVAEKAEVTRDNKQVFMRGNVQLIKPPLEGIPAAVLRTEALTVYPDDDIAEGNSRVTITRGLSTISGDGIHYNGKTSTVVLAGRVKGIFHRVKKS